MDLNQISAFIAVAQAGSYSQAARQSEIPKSTLSRQVSELEKRLGVVLIQRSTRKFQLTQMGRLYFEECRRLLKDLEELEKQALAIQDEPQGLVRFTAPAEVGSNLLAPLFLEFSRKFPKIDLDLVFTDRVVNMIEEKFDLALRTWNVADPSLKAKKLGPEKFVLTCAPSYFKKGQGLKHPKEIQNHTVIAFSSRKDPHSWKLTNGKERVTLSLQCKYLVNTLSVCKRLTQEGMGLSFLPYFFAEEDIKTGALMHVLPDWSTEPTQFALVYPDQKYVPAKTRVLIDFLGEKLKERLSE
ncbi:MAG: LysR family transcriptional regulator [Proteobacteria bacterium]|jgi:DNA-binding transcriptional LysR family regulator|nr:LysR family transcriptional regulator [Pseudomonadota bacterium]